jgi:hypothetical protein
MNFFEKIRPYPNQEKKISETNSSQIITGDELLTMDIDDYPTLLDPSI